MDVNYSTVVAHDSLVAIINLLYVKLLADDVTSPYFYGHDPDRIKPHMVKLVWGVLGGADDYRGRDLGDAHRHIRAQWERQTILGRTYVEVGPGITERVWQRTGMHLLDSFTAQGYTDPGLHNHLAAKLATVHDKIVTAVEPRRRFARLRGKVGRRARHALRIGYVAALFGFVGAMDWYVAGAGISLDPVTWTTWGMLAIAHVLALVLAVWMSIRQVRRWRGLTV